MLEGDSLGQEISCDVVPPKKNGPGSSWRNCDIKCGVQECPSSTMGTPNLWFYRLPLYSSNNQMRQKWLQQIGLTEEVPLHLFVCQKHFTSRDIRCRAAGRKSLKKSAFPTLLLPSHPIEKPVKRSRPKHVYERNVSDATKRQVNKPVEKRSNQDTSTDMSGKNLNKNKGLMDIDDNKIKPVKERRTQDNSSDISGKNLRKKSEMYIDDNKNNQDKSQVNDDNVNQEHSHLKDSMLSNGTLNSLNDLYLKLKSKRESFNNKYSDEYKLKVFQLYHDNTEAYKLLQSTLGLPPVSTLPCYGPSTLDGINHFYMSSLIDKVGLKPLKHKFAVICVNVMRIQPVLVYDDEKDKLSGVWLGTKTAPLQYAMVAMVRGIVEDWHHIVSISLLPSLNMCNEYCTFIENLIIGMLEIGINIKAVVTSADDLFQTATVLKSKPSFLVKTYKVYHIFDPVHLMLLLYDELNNYNVFYSEKTNEMKAIATWEDINEFYKCDKTQKFRLTNQSSYINKTESHKNKLESAAQILSFKTAMGMSMYFNMKILDSNVMDTVDFLVRINSILAALYPKAFDSQLKVIQDDNFWCESIQYIEGIRTALSKNLKFTQFLVISMKTVACLQSLSYLKEHGSVLMQCLNQDPLVEFIDKINLKSYTKRYPTETELIDTLRHGIIQNNYHNMMKIDDHSRLDSFIEDLTKLSDQSCFIQYNSNNIEQTNMADYTQLNHEVANSMYYISIYLLDKMYKMYKKALSSRMKHMSSSVVYENKLQEFCGSIIVPDNEFIEFVNKMDVIFVTYFKKAIGTGRLFEELMNAMNKLIVTGPVDLAPLQYIKGLFLELRIYHTVKQNNETFQNTDSDNQQFVACRLNSQGFLLDTPKS